MNNLTDLPGHDLHQKYLSGEFTAVELVDSYLKRINETNPALNSFLTVCGDFAMDQARAIDQRRSEKKPLGRLAGTCIAVKDNICVKGLRTTAGSRILENFTPTYDATAIERLLREDTIIIGKTNLDEFAMGSSTEYSAFGPCRHPVDHERIPGGSSGGSAVAVAAGQATFALGSETGGSVRQPASLCGIYGYKPTYGTVSRYGLIAFASSVDQIGHFARDIRDIEDVYSVIRGYDPQDSTTVRTDTVQPKPEKDKWTVGIPAGLPRDQLEREVGVKYSEFQKMLKGRNVELVEIQMPSLKFTIETYYIIVCAEASSNLARFDGIHFTSRAGGNTLDEIVSGSRSRYLGAEVKRRIMLGTYVLAKGYYDAYYLQALKVRRRIKNDFDAAFAKCDFILTPTSPMTAFKLGEKVTDPIQMYLCDIFTAPANLAGIPAISIPFGADSKGLPIGMQVIAPAFHDLALMNFAKSIL